MIDDKPDAQPTPSIEPGMDSITFCRSHPDDAARRIIELERALAAANAELQSERAAREQEKARADAHFKDYQRVCRDIEAERTAREQAERMVTDAEYTIGIHCSERKKAEQRLAAVEAQLEEQRTLTEQVSGERFIINQKLTEKCAQLAGVVERCAKVCEEISVSMHYMKAGQPVSRVDDAFDDAIRQCADAIRALAAAPTSECCGEQIDAANRYCPKCGWECRITAAPDEREPR